MKQGGNDMICRDLYVYPSDSSSNAVDLQEKQKEKKKRDGDSEDRGQRSDVGVA